MNNLILSNKKTMSSLEIAELAGRNHKDVFGIHQKNGACMGKVMWAEISAYIKKC